MFDYEPNSQTEGYQKEVDKVYDLVKQIAEQKPEKLEKALTLAERFSRKYAEWINTGFNIDMMCPSVMISGSGNFPVRKKEKQNARLDKHYQYYNDYLKEIPKWIKDLLYDKEIIKSNDPDAIEQLTAKLEKLQKEREDIKAYNTKMRTEGKPEEQTAPYMLQNLGQNIRSVEQRLESLLKVKEKPTKEYETTVCKVVENTELMRIQLVFDSIPPVETREILKSNGFKWAPSQGAWQRQLTDNARYATKKVLQQLEA
jgi:DNA repair exonuclease SbcCD ATPase subunit